MSKVAKIQFGPATAATESAVEKLMDFYTSFSRSSVRRLEDFYTQDVEFVDPVHTVNGLLALKSYLRDMAENMQHYEIRYLEKMERDGAAHLSWEMTFIHRRLNNGLPITVRGMSYLKFTSKVYYHEDSYDLGALVYEHVPVLGRFIRFMRSRLKH